MKIPTVEQILKAIESQEDCMGLPISEWRERMFVAKLNPLLGYECATENAPEFIYVPESEKMLWERNCLISEVEGLRHRVTLLEAFIKAFLSLNESWFAADDDTASKEAIAENERTGKAWPNDLWAEASKRRGDAPPENRFAKKLIEEVLAGLKEDVK